MKKIKNLTCAVVTAALALSLTVPAIAAEERVVVRHCTQCNVGTLTTYTSLAVETEGIQKSVLDAFFYLEMRKKKASSIAESCIHRMQQY